LQEFLTDVPAEVNAAADAGSELLIEGSQGFGLSLYYGDYPYVTSKDTTAASFCADVGLGPTKVDQVLVVFKAFASRVGTGPMPTELPVDVAQARGWEEFGAVTGRPRRIGDFDYELAERAAMINGATEIGITNLDRRFEGCAGLRDWEKLPDDAKDFVSSVEDRLNRPAMLLSTGPDVYEMIDRR
jgi:adenylosuccinate synthase